VSACPRKSSEITEKGFPGDPEKSDSVMVNGLFRPHQHLDSEPE
jgi:hypothetical protein